MKIDASRMVLCLLLLNGRKTPYSGINTVGVFLTVLHKSTGFPPTFFSRIDNAVVIDTRDCAACA